MTVKVDGADTLARTAHGAADDLTDLTALNRRVAAAIAARVRAPRRTGRLAASIVPTGDPSTALVGTSLVYAPVQEYGWPARNIRAHRFMQSAAAVTEPSTIAAYTREVRSIVATVKGA